MKLQIKKNQKGFTLVEVIVVAIIVAAMAAVAVPLYLGYVDSSRKNAAANAAGSIASFCGACGNTAGTLAATGGALGAAVTGSLTCTPSGGGALTSIQIPGDIVTQVFNTGTPRVVARHSSSAPADTVIYRF